MTYLPLIIFSTFLYIDKGYILHILVIVYTILQLYFTNFIKQE